jgi:calcineurin-like phosphoesterase family protein
MKTWFTSDNHWGHARIIEYCARPFRKPDGQPDLHVMNRVMTERWNEVVGPRDTVYHLGDFAFGKPPEVLRYRQKLQGRIILIRGNHDRNTRAMLQAGMDEVHDSLELDLDGYALYLSHIPRDALLKAPRYYHYWLCGHVHESWLRRGKVINVGVDRWDFRPRSLQEILGAKDGT